MSLEIESARVKEIKQDTGYPFGSSVKYKPIFYFMFVRYLAVSAIASRCCHRSLVKTFLGIISRDKKPKHYCKETKATVK